MVICVENDQNERGDDLLENICARTATLVCAYSNELNCWKASTTSSHAPDVLYIGSCKNHGVAAVGWRRVKILDKIYSEIVIVYTEKEHRRKGMGNFLVRKLIELHSPVLSDREGMSQIAFNLRMGLSGVGNMVLNIETGVECEVDDFGREKILMYDTDSSRAGRYQIVSRAT